MTLKIKIGDMSIKEKEIENELIKKLVELKYVRRDDIKDRISLEVNFRKKFESLNKVKPTDTEFARLLNETFIIVPFNHPPSMK